MAATPNSSASQPPPANGAPSIAIVGGGISGLSVGYELARRQFAFTLFESSGRLGGTVETVRSGDYIIECGPDSWVTEKPWARELTVELGLEDQILHSNDRQRVTYLWKKGMLVPLPDGMRMMVPVKWPPLLRSPLFSRKAKLAYLREPGRASEFKRSIGNRNDESVASFVRRHFGTEVTNTIAGPLLAGVFGGDVETLSARAVMPAFVAMEAEQGSLITALRKRTRDSKTPQAIFSTIEGGLETLVDRLTAYLPTPSLELRQPITAIRSNGKGWTLTTPNGQRNFDSLVLATPPHITRELLLSLSGAGSNVQRMADLLPQLATSAIVVAFCFDAARANSMRIPRGFGFLVPPAFSGADNTAEDRDPSLLACTFVDQKFPRRAPPGGVLLRAFFGGHSAEALLGESDEALARRARQELCRILGSLPEPVETLVRRWPLSLPQYAVGHLDRIAELESLAASWPGLRLVGNAYHGVGLSDLIREGRATARTLIDSLGTA